MYVLMMLIAIAVEIAATSLLRSTEGFTRPLPTALCLAGYLLAFTLIARVVQHLPVGVVYAIWSGVGTVVVAAIGVAFLGDRLNAPSIVGLALVVVGVLLLNVSGRVA